MWIIIGRFVAQIILQVLIKLVLTVFSKEMIGKLMFACLHRLKMIVLLNGPYRTWSLTFLS